MKLKRLFLAGILALSAISSVQAGTVTEAYTFSLGKFVDIIGNSIPTVSSIQGSFTLTFDPALQYTNETAGITTNYLTGVAVDTDISFTTFLFSPYQIFIGGKGNGATFLGPNTNDFYWV
jgi:hypothetical protein